MQASILCAQCLGTKKSGRKSVSDTDQGNFKYKVCQMQQSSTWTVITGKSKFTVPETVTFFPVKPSQVFSYYLNLPIPDEQ